MSSTGPRPAPAPALTVRWRLEPERIAANYQVSNGADHPLVLFDLLYRTAEDGARLPDLSQCYRSLDEAGVLVVFKGVPALPPDRDVESPEMPFARIVMPGGIARGRVLFDFPVTAHLAYPPPLAKKPVVLPYRPQSPARLVIGCAPADAALKTKTFQVEGETYHSVPHNWAVQRQRLIAREVADLAQFTLR